MEDAAPETPPPRALRARELAQLRGVAYESEPPGDEAPAADGVLAVPLESDAALLSTSAPLPAPSRPATLPPMSLTPRSLETVLAALREAMDPRGLA